MDAREQSPLEAFLSDPKFGPQKPIPEVKEETTTIEELLWDARIYYGVPQDIFIPHTNVNPRVSDPYEVSLKAGDPRIVTKPCRIFYYLPNIITAPTVVSKSRKGMYLPDEVFRPLSDNGIWLYYTDYLEGHSFWRKITKEDLLKPLNEDLRKQFAKAIIEVTEKNKRGETAI